MTEDQVQFYLRNRRQIMEWAALAPRVEDLMRSAVDKRDVAGAMRIMNGDSGEADADFYVRNRALIVSWAALETQAGAVLHEALLEASHDAGCDVTEGNRGTFRAVYPRSRFGEFPESKTRPSVHLSWTKNYLLTAGRGASFPRLALALHPDHWTPQDRARMVEWVRPIATRLGMTKHDREWAYWCMLAEIEDSQDPREYADACLARLKDASEQLYPTLRDALDASAE